MVLDEWVLGELPKLYRERPDVVQPFLDHVLQDQNMRWTLVVRAYQDERINLGKAAELLELHSLELKERFRKLGIPIRQGPSDEAEARAEVEAVRAWYTSNSGADTSVREWESMQ